MALPAGWYPVSGDPEGTQRYWDGASFTTGPKVGGTRARRHGFNPVASTSTWRLAGPIARAVAGFVDVFAPLVIMVGLANATGVGLPEPDAHQWAAERNLLIALGSWIVLNHVLLVGLFGTSLGKILLGLRVVDRRTRTQPPGLARALLREVLLVPCLIGTVALFGYGRREGLHDIIAGTAVVYV